MATTPRLQPNLSSRERAALAALRADRLGTSESRNSGLKSLSQQEELRLLDSGLTSPEDLAALLDPTDASPEEFLNNLKQFSSDIQVDWDAIDLKQLPAGIGDGVQTTLDALNSTIEVLKEFVSLIKAGLELFALVAQVGIDILRIAFEAALLALEAAIDVFYSTSGSMLRILPQTNRELLPTSGTLSRIAQTYDNELDSERPISRSTSDVHVFVFFMVVGPNLEGLLAQIRALAPLFDTDEFDKIFSKPDLKPEDYPTFIEANKPLRTFYNWEGARLTDIAAFRDFVLGVKDVIASVTMLKGRVEMVSRAIELILQRLERLESQVNSILDTIEILANILALPMNTLTLYGPGSIQDIQTALQGASQLESSPVKGFNNQELCAGYVFHAVLGAGRSLDFLRFIFQIKERVNNKVETVLIPAAERTVAAHERLSARTISERDQLRVS